MNYEVDIKPRLDAGKTHAQIVEEVNAERRALVSNYRSITSTEVTDWLASDGRLYRIDTALQAFSAQPTYGLFASAWDGVKSIRSNINAAMRVSPGSPHRSLVENAILAGLMEESDLTSLDAIAYHGRDSTEAEVAQVIEASVGLAAQWNKLITLGNEFIDSNPEATLQEVFDAVETEILEEPQP